MSLNNIQLQDIIVRNLFNHLLVDLKPDNSFQKTSTFTFSGNNLKKNVFVFNYPEIIQLPQHLSDFLSGILTACNLSMADIALVNTSENVSFTHEDIKRELQAEKIILFGINTADLQLPFQFPHYQVQQFNSQLYLSAPELSLLENNKSEKAKLWQCLKTIFLTE